MEALQISISNTNTAKRIGSDDALVLFCDTFFPIHVALLLFACHRSPALLRRAAAAFGVRVIESNVVRDRALQKNEFGLFLARHYKFMLDAVLRTSSHAGSYVVVPPIVPYDYVVVVEDDLKLANDTVKFFAETARLLRHDATLAAVLGWASNSYPASAHHPSPLRPLQPLEFVLQRVPGFMSPLCKFIAEKLPL